MLLSGFSLGSSNDKATCRYLLWRMCTWNTAEPSASRREKTEQASDPSRCLATLVSWLKTLTPTSDWFRTLCTRRPNDPLHQVHNWSCRLEEPICRPICGKRNGGSRLWSRALCLSKPCLNKLFQCRLFGPRSLKCFCSFKAGSQYATRLATDSTSSCLSFWSTGITLRSSVSLCDFEFSACCNPTTTYNCFPLEVMHRLHD